VNNLDVFGIKDWYFKILPSLSQYHEVCNQHKLCTCFWRNSVVSKRFRQESVNKSSISLLISSELINNLLLFCTNIQHLHLDTKLSYTRAKREHCIQYRQDLKVLNVDDNTTHVPGHMRNWFSEMQSWFLQVRRAKSKPFSIEEAVRCIICHSTRYFKVLVLILIIVQRHSDFVINWWLR
jgi:hypothetical protein